MREDVAVAELMQIVREEMLPLDRNYFRRAATLEVIARSPGCELEAG